MKAHGRLTRIVAIRCRDIINDLYEGSFAATAKVPAVAEPLDNDAIVGPRDEQHVVSNPRKVRDRARHCVVCAEDWRLDHQWPVRSRRQWHVWSAFRQRRYWPDLQRVVSAAGRDGAMSRVPCLDRQRHQARWLAEEQTRQGLDLILVSAARMASQNCHDHRPFLGPGLTVVVAPPVPLRRGLCFGAKYVPDPDALIL